MTGQKMWTDQQTAYFCRSLSLQLRAGISLADGIYLMAEEETGAWKDRLLWIAAGLDRGEPLETVLTAGGCLPDYVCAMVKAGQETGKLEQTLASLGQYYDQRSYQKRQIKNAVAYPAMVFALMLVVVTVLLVKVLPVFEGVYASLGGRLTGVAAGFLYLGQFLKNALPVILAALAVCGIATIVCWKVDSVRTNLTGAFRKRFGDRGIFRLYNNARFAQTLAMGLSSGLTLDASMELAENLLLKIPGAAARCRICREQLETGASLPEAMKTAQLLSKPESRMLAMGLRAGNGDQVMEEIALRLSRDAEQSLEELVAKIEPAMVLTASGLVGVILLAVMLPLIDIMSAIG